MKLTIKSEEELLNNVLFTPSVIQILALKNALINNKPVLFNPVEEKDDSLFSLEIVNENPIEQSEMENYKKELIKPLISLFTLANVEYEIFWS